MKARLKELFAPIDLTKGNIFKVIIVFMIPIMISYFFQQIYTLTDAIIVGQNLSGSEVNGVNDVGSLTYIVLQFAFGCAAGFSVVSSEKEGQKDLRGVRQSFFVQVVLSFFISVVLTVLAVLLIDPLLSLVGLRPGDGGLTYEAAKTYIFIIFLGTICQVAYNQICSLLRSIGDSLTPLLFLIGSTVLNIGLDLLFIVVIPWGAAGAAIATVVAQGLSAVLCYVYTFVKYPWLRFKKEDFRIAGKEYGRHLKLGLPLAFQFSILAIGLITLQSTIVKFDTTPEGLVMAAGAAELAYGAVNKLSNFMMCPLNALGTAILSYEGQNKGAGEEARAKKGFRAAVLIMLGMYAIILAVTLLLLIDDAFLKLFYSASSISEDTVYLGRINLLMNIPFFPLVGMVFVFRGTLQGVGKPLWPLLAGCAELLARTLLCLYGPYIFTSFISTELDLYQNPWPFVVTVLADAFAWLMADLTFLVGFAVVFHHPTKKAEGLQEAGK